MEIMMLVTMLGAIYAGHYAQKCYHVLQDIKTLQMSQIESLGQKKE